MRERRAAAGGARRRPAGRLPLRRGRARRRRRRLTSLLVVGAALVDDLAAPTRLLAARRSAPPALAGRWELPGGKVEAGESAERALHRELAEELGVRVTLGREVPAPDGAGWPLSSAAVLRVWLAVVAGGDPAPLQDHDELRWLERPSWLCVAWLPADLPVVAALQGSRG